MKPLPFVNLLIGCVLIGMHWGIAPAAAAYFIVAAMLSGMRTANPSTPPSKRP